MIVLALVSQKGGGGKTTLAVAFAVAHERRAGGGRAVVVDLDPQGSASMWGGLRAPDAGPPVIDAAPRSLARTLADAEGAGTGLAVVDTPPQLAAAAREASRLADLVLVPCRAAAADLHAVAATLDVCRAAGAGRRCWIVLNAVPPRGPLAREARETVEDSLVARVAPVALVQRIAHVHAFTMGRTAQETEPSSLAAGEAEALYRWAMAAARRER